MEIKPIPIAVVGVGLTVLILGLTAGKSKKSIIYLDAENAGANNNVDFNAFDVARTLEIAMNQYGTDEDTIMQALSEISVSQMKQVISAFGSKRYNTWTGDSYGIYSYPLKVWLKEELSTSSYLTLKSKFKNLL